jgi:hypothetical protein
MLTPLGALWLPLRVSRPPTVPPALPSVGVLQLPLVSMLLGALPLPLGVSRSPPGATPVSLRYAMASVPSSAIVVQLTPAH